MKKESVVQKIVVYLSSFPSLFIRDHDLNCYHCHVGVTSITIHFRKVKDFLALRKPQLTICCGHTSTPSCERNNQTTKQPNKMPSQVMHYTRYQNNRPTTAACSSRGTLVRGGTTNSDRSQSGLGQHLSVNKFRSEFPNLPGFSKFTTLRPNSPKVSRIKGTQGQKYAFTSHRLTNNLNFNLQSAICNLLIKPFVLRFLTLTESITQFQEWVHDGQFCPPKTEFIPQSSPPNNCTGIIIKIRTWTLKRSGLAQ